MSKKKNEQFFCKLVRDNIPEIILSKGESCKTSILTDEQFVEELNKKLSEELKEYLKSHEVSELADLVEVIYALVKQKGLTLEEFEEIRLDKRKARGGFDRKIFLQSTFLE